MKKILNDEDLKEKSKDLYDLLNDFKEELLQTRQVEVMKFQLSYFKS